MEKIKIVPQSLRNWFIFHFAADILFAIPVFIAPEASLKLLQWEIIDPITTRMVAAALFGIGIESFLCRNSGIEVFKSMLNLKIIWSFTAIIGLGIALTKGYFGNIYVGVFLFLTFLLFNFLWVYWRVRLKNN
jgi:hypothetical protein